MEFDAEFESDIISQSLRNDAYLKQACDVVENHHFMDEQHGFIWETVVDVHRTHGETLSSKIFLSRARDKYPDNEERAAALVKFKELKMAPVIAPRAALEELSKFTRWVKAQSACEDMVKCLELGQVDKVYEIARPLAVDDVERKNFTVIRWIEEFKQRQEERKKRKLHPELYPVIRTRIKRLDDVIDGIRPTELGIVAATTGVGKSVLMTNLLYAGIKSKEPTPFFSTEMHAEQVATRLDSLWSKLLHKKFRSYDFTKKELKEIEARLTRGRRLFNKLCQIISMPVGMASIEACRNEVLRMQDEIGKKVRYIIMDSGDHLKPARTYKDKRHEQADIYWGLKAWCDMDAVAMWSSAQLGKQARDRTGTAEDLSEAYDKGRIANIVATLNRPAKKSRATPTVEIGEDEDDGKGIDETKVTMAGAANLELFLTKYRDGESQVKIPLETDLKRMLIKSAAELKEA